jgi:hypothetical protein
VNATVIGGAASTAIADMLTGPNRPARVLGAFAKGTYLLLSDIQVIALLTPTATRLPNAVLAATTNSRSREGDPACVGEHCIRMPGLEVRVARWWSPRQVRPLRSLVRLDQALAAHPAQPEWPEWSTPAVVRDATAQLGHAAAAGDLPAVHLAATGLVGIGPGLTPSGDDVLAGFLLGLRALDQVSANAPHLAHAVRGGIQAAQGRTTALAATLVRHAEAGEAPDVVADLVDALAEDDPVDGPLRALLATGHTSGRDLAEGLLLAGRATLGLDYGERS